MNGLGFMNAVYATSISSANVYSIGDCGELLKYKGIVVKTNYVQYSENGMNYPAYCMDKTKKRSRSRRVYSIGTRCNKRCRVMEKNDSWISL